MTAETFSEFTYSRNSHFKYFQDKDIDIRLYGKRLNPDDCDARRYQNMLVYSYVLENLKPGSVILEIGNEDSPLLKKLIENNYVCWNLNFVINNSENENSEDIQVEWKLKNENGIETDLNPINYFDFIYSVSAFENIPENLNSFKLFSDKIKSLLKPMSYSLNCFIGSVNNDNLTWNNRFYNYLNDQNLDLNLESKRNSFTKDKDLFYLSESYFNKNWKLSEEMLYDDLGKMFSLNILWQFNDKLLNRCFQDFTYSKKSHFDLFSQAGYSYKLFGKEIPESDRNIKNYQEQFIYSYVVNNFKKGSKILAVGNNSDNLKKALSDNYDFYYLNNPVCITQKILNSSDPDLPDIINSKGEKLDIFPLKYFDFIFSLNEFSEQGFNILHYSKIVSNLKLIKKEFGYVLTCINTVFCNGSVYRNDFLYYLFNNVPKINKFEKLDSMLNDPDLFIQCENEFNLNEHLNSVSVKVLCSNILWRTYPQLPIISFKRPEDTLERRPAYIFHHIMKCGGTSVVMTLFQWFKVVFDHIEDQHGIYRDLNDYLNYKINLQNLYSDSCIVAHFQYDGYMLPQRYPEVIGRKNEFRIFTFIREPLELMISLYYYGRYGISSNLESYLRIQNNTLSTFFPCNPENYKEVIDSYFFVGIVENMQESFDKLADLTGNKRVQLPFINKSSKDEQVLKLPDKFIETFKKNNALDYKIYDYCLEKFKKL